MEFLTYMDNPDPDVIRVGDTYYMVTTTMYFMPGCELFRSYDLVNWEHAAYVYDILEDTPAQRLEGGQHAYGKGMWAASLRYHNGRFYICFVANDTKKTYLFTAEEIEGPWKKQYIEGFYHDNSILFDEDGRVYIIYGQKEIFITELEADLSGPKKGGLEKRILHDEYAGALGFEGSHIYKINGKYVIMVCHMPAVNACRKVQSCFVADSLLGSFRGGIVLSDDRGFRNLGVAQGCLVDTPEGKWYSILFQDVGAAGRIPVLCPVEWMNGFPVFGHFGTIPEGIQVGSTRPDYTYEKLYCSDDFYYTADDEGKVNLKSCWQWNHIPNSSLWSVTKNPGALRIQTGKLCANVTQAENTLTQRMRFPRSEAIVTLEGSHLEEGDYAGLVALEGCYAMIALTKKDGRYCIVLLAKPAKNPSLFGEGGYDQPGTELISIPVSSGNISFKLCAEFGKERDIATFYYQSQGEWQQLGEKYELFFKMDHFTGCRFGLSVFSTIQTGGYADFSDFRYR